MGSLDFNVVAVTRMKIFTIRCPRHQLRGYGTLRTTASRIQIIKREFAKSCKLGVAFHIGNADISKIVAFLRAIFKNYILWPDLSFGPKLQYIGIV
jgi:hypothetical protein